MSVTCKVSVVIPVYNEIENITEISNQINQVFNDENIDISNEIINRKIKIIVITISRITFAAYTHLYDCIIVLIFCLSYFHMLPCIF